MNLSSQGILKASNVEYCNLMFIETSPIYDLQEETTPTLRERRWIPSKETTFLAAAASSPSWVEPQKLNFPSDGEKSFRENRLNLS